MIPTLCIVCLERKTHFTDNICTDCFHNQHSKKTQLFQPCTDKCSILNLKQQWEKKWG